jgi:hypothetical protein
VKVQQREIPNPRPIATVRGEMLKSSLTVKAAKSAQRGPGFKLSERLRAAENGYKNGNLEGLYEALMLLIRVGGIAPDWVLGGAIKIVKNHLDTKATAPGGPKANAQSADKYDAMHIRRWRLAKAFLKIEPLKRDAWRRTNALLSKHGDSHVTNGSISKSYSYIEEIRSNPEALQNLMPWMFQRAKKSAAFVDNPKLPLTLADGYSVDLSNLKKLNLTSPK